MAKKGVKGYYPFTRFAADVKFEKGEYCQKAVFTDGSCLWFSNTNVYDHDHNPDLEVKVRGRRIQ